MTNKGLHIRILLMYLLPVYLLAIILLAIFRSLFVAHFCEDFLLLYSSWSELLPILAKGFVKGLRYDAMVVSYVMVLPLIGLVVCWGLKKSPKTYLKLSKIYFIIAFALIFMLSCMDFPYFKYFWTHPTITIFDWVGFSGTFGMLFQETSYYIYYLLFILSLSLITASIIICSRWASKVSNTNRVSTNKMIQGGLFAFALLIVFMGTRGHMSLKPLDVNAAYFTDNRLVSDFCITPAYHFIVHLNDYEVNFDELMDSELSIKNVQRQINPIPDSAFKNPFSRRIIADSTRQTKHYNIVLVFMESLSADLLHQEINGRKLTPFLDSLSQSAYYFNNFYSTGVHTNVGVASTMISYPSRFNKHMMTRQPSAYKGIASELKTKGYHNLFFIPNEEVYDNMDIFLKKNGIDTIFSDRHYQRENKVNNFGVPDDFLFDFAIQELGNSKKEPFFAGILTVSNHPPYIVPEEYKCVSERDDIAILSYVDASVANFMHKASSQDWFENTIFIFQGDHGKMAHNQIYNMPLSYNHIPLIIYSPAFADMPQLFEQFGGQIDIYPTVMGLINESYVNNTMGVDLLKDKRPYMFFSSDTHLGCIDDKFFYVFDPKDGCEYLYDEVKKDGVNVIETNREVANKMKEYALSMLTATNRLEKEERMKEY